MNFFLKKKVNCDLNRTISRSSNVDRRQRNNQESGRNREFLIDDEDEDEDESSFDMSHLDEFIDKYSGFKSSNLRTNFSDDEDKNEQIPCEFCNRPFDIEFLETHQVFQ